MKIYPGLAKIKGISWSVSNAICKILKIDKNKKIGELSEKEIKEIEDFMKNSTSPLEISASLLFKPLSANWAYWSAGINGFPRRHA